MKKLLILGLLLTFFQSAWSQGIVYPSNSMATTDNALSTVTNPAWLGIRPGAEALLLFPYADSTSNEDLGLMVKLGSLGFSGEFVNSEPNMYNRYTLASGFELTQGLYMGLGYSWYRAVDWQGSWNLGLGCRPLPFLSAGAVAYDLNQPDRGGQQINASYGLALALRPLGYRLTLSGDLLFTKTATHDYGQELDPRLRLELMPVDGLRLVGEYHTDSQFFSAGASIAVDNVALGNFRRMNDGGNHLNSVGYLHLTSARQANLLSPRSHQIVEITLEGKIRETEAPFSFFGRGEGKTLRQICREIRHYSDDPQVDGLLITFNGADMGLAQAQQLRRYLEDFKATGKKLIAYAESYSQRDYYLASICDEIYLLPVGEVNIRGLSAVMGYWKGTLDKLGIGVQVVRVKDYKTAGNAFVFDDTPEAEAEMVNWLLDGIFNNLYDKIAAGRKWTMEEAKTKVEGGFYLARDASKAGIVDKLSYYDELTQQLEDQDYVLVNENGYWKLGEYDEEWPDSRTPRVAVIYAEGAIASGQSGSGFFSGQVMGSETIAEAIRKAREDKSIDAIILRVDSPGGSGVASDVIYREVQRTTTGKDKKPLIVSMGNVAGSGGYYISMAADTIIAEESTITGSIGVIFLKPNLQGLHQKIGYNTHTFKRGEHADVFSMARPMSEDELQILGASIKDWYDDFSSKVAAARGMTKAAVDSIGEGRVWTGEQAQERGLVDLIGGMDVAFNVTRAQLGLEEEAPLNLEFYPKPRGFFASLSNEILALGQEPLPQEIGEALQPIYLAITYYDGKPLMLMPYIPEIK